MVTLVGLCFVGMPKTHNMFVYLRTRGSAIPLYTLEVLVRLTSEGDLDLSNPDPGGVTGFGIRAGLSVGNPCYWSMLSLVLVKTISKMKSIYETLVCFFYSLPSFALLLGYLTLC